MKKIIEEQKSKLQPFFSEYSDNFVEEEIESIVALKDLGL